MKHIHTHHRSRQFSLREKRLIGLDAAMEMLSQQFLETAQKASPQNAGVLLNELMKKVEATQQPEFFEAFRQQCEGLGASVRQVITTNLEAAAKSATITTVGKQLEALQIAVGTIANDTIDTVSTHASNAVDTVSTHTTKTKKTFSETASEIVDDFKNGGTLTKVGYIAGGVVGFLAVRWVWRKLRAMWSDEKEGFVSKTGKLLAGIGGAIVGALGINKVVDWWKGRDQSEEDMKNRTPGVLPIIVPPTRTGPDGRPENTGPFDRTKNSPWMPDDWEDGIEGMAEGVMRGYKDAEKFFGDSFKAVSEIGGVMKVWNERASYSSDALFFAALTAECIRSGASFAFLEGKAFLTFAGKLYPLTTEFYAGFLAGDVDIGDIFSTYIEGAVVYATSLQALRLLTGARYGKNARVLLETAGWPVSVIGRSAHGAYKAAWMTVHAHDTSLNVGSSIARRKASVGTSFAKMKSTIFRMSDADKLEMQYHFIKRFEHIRDHVRSSHWNQEKFKKVYDDALDDFLRRVQSMKEADIPDWFMKMKNEKLSNVPLHALSRENMHEIITHTYPDEIMTSTSKAASSTPTPSATKAAAAGSASPKPSASTAKKPAAQTPVPTEGGPAPKLDDVPDVKPQSKFKVITQSGDVVDPAVTNNKWSDAVKALGEGEVTSKNVDAFIDIAKKADLIDPDTASLISQSQKAREILIGAAQTGDAAEMSRVVRAARVARNWRAGFNALGAAGDVFGLYIAIADFQENGANIEMAKQTKNAELAKVYEGARLMNVVEGLEAGGSLAYGATVIGWSLYSGETLLTAVSATGAVVMLPISVAVLTAGYARRMTTTASEIWMRGAEDWVAALSAGELLEKLDEIGPGSRGTKEQRWVMGSFAEQSVRYISSRHSAKAREQFRQWEEGNDSTIEGANERARYNITKAYVIHTSAESLSPLPDESDSHYQERFDQFVTDQMTYIQMATQGSYSRLLGPGYSMARDHARLLAESRDLKKNNGHRYIVWNDSETGEEKMFDVADYVDTTWSGKGDVPSQTMLVGRNNTIQKTMTVAQFVIEKQSKASERQTRTAMKQQLLLEIQDELNKLNGRLENADYSGVLGWDSANKSASRKVAQMMITEELDRQASLLLSKTPIGVGDFDNAVFKLRAICETQDVMRFEKEAKRRGITADERTAGLQILTLPGMMAQVSQ